MELIIRGIDIRWGKIESININVQTVYVSPVLRLTVMCNDVLFPHGQILILQMSFFCGFAPTWIDCVSSNLFVVLLCINIDHTDVSLPHGQT